MAKNIYCHTCEKWIDHVEAANYHRGHYMPDRFTGSEAGDANEAYIKMVDSNVRKAKKTDPLADMERTTCSCGWNGKIAPGAHGQRCPNCGEALS